MKYVQKVKNIADNVPLGMFLLGSFNSPEKKSTDFVKVVTLYGTNKTMDIKDFFSFNSS